MKALYAEAPKQTVLRTDYPIPALKAKGVRVKVKLSGVAPRLQALLAGKTKRCSLARISNSSLVGEIFTPLLAFPFVPGGGPIGIVDEIGPEVVSDLKKGELVICAYHYGTTCCFLRFLLEVNPPHTQRQDASWHFTRILPLGN